MLKKYLLPIVALFSILAYAGVPMRLGDGVYVSKFLYPASTGILAGNSTARFEGWFTSLNILQNQGAAYINSTGSIASLTSVSPTELGYLDGVSGPIQPQLDAKLDKALAQNNIFVGNSLGQAVGVSQSGDGSYDDTGNFQIALQAIVDADINNAAAISYSKLNLLNSIIDADINAAAAIAYTKLNLANSLLTADYTANSVTNAILAQMPNFTVKGRYTAGTGNPEDLIPSQLNEIVGSENIAFTKSVAINAHDDASTGNIDSLSTTNRSNIRLTGVVTALRGIAGGADGKVLLVTNATGFALPISNEHATPTAVNRIITGTGAAVSLADTASATLIYDSTTQRWRVVGLVEATGGGGGGATLTTNTYTADQTLSDANDVVLCNPPNGTTITITLHAVSTATMKEYSIKNISSGGSCVVAAGGGDDIEGDATLILNPGGTPQSGNILIPNGGTSWSVW